MIGDSSRLALFESQRLGSLDVLVRIVEINGEPGIVSYLGGRPQSVFSIEARGGRIRGIYTVTNPEKLSHLPPPGPRPPPSHPMGSVTI